MTSPLYRRHPARFELRNKVSASPLSRETLVAMQNAAKTVPQDITPEINHSLHVIRGAIEQAATSTYGRENHLPTVTRHVMHIKAVSGMFGRKAIAAPATLILDFLEENARLDDDSLDIISAFINVVNRAQSPDLTDYDAQKHFTALSASCQRYTDKITKNKGG